LSEKERDSALMAKENAIPAAVSRQLVELSVTQPPVHSFNRQFARIVVDTVGAEAVTLWLVRQNELLLCEQIEERLGAVRDIRVSEQAQQEALRKAFEKGEMSVFAEEARPPVPDAGAEHRLVFIPIIGLQGNVGVMRLVMAAAPSELFSRLIQLAESLSGYYSLYHAQRVLSAQHEERQDIDKLSKTILQLQHYSFSRQLPEVVVNSAMEVAPLDRAVLLTRERGGEIKIAAVSSVSSPDHKGAWARLICELGELVLRRGEPVHYLHGRTPPDQLEDEQLRNRQHSYVAMTEVTSLLLYPLRSSEEDLGVLVLEKFGPQHLSDFESVLCTVYASHVASALGNHRLFTNLPFSRLIARRVDQEADRPRRGPGKTARVLKWAIAVLALAALVWWLGLHPVPEKVGARCFVMPGTERMVTAKVSGEIEKVLFDQGDFVQQGELLLKFRTDEIELEINQELENAANIETEVNRYRGEAEDERNMNRRSELLAEVGALTHRLRAKEYEIALLRSVLADCSLSAPISGIVLEPQEPRELLGYVVQEGEALCRVGSIAQQVRVRVAVPAERVSDVREGQEVEIRLRPLIIDRILRGRIETLAERSVTYKNANVFMADVFVDNFPLEDPGPGGGRYLLKPGMTGKAKIVRERRASYFVIYGKVLYAKLKYWLY